MSAGPDPNQSNGVIWGLVIATPISIAIWGLLYMFGDIFL